MGPRALARGNISAEEALRRTSLGFNGAARSRARKFALDLEFADEGQASMGPRALARGNFLRIFASMNMTTLQWGRALSRAEIRNVYIESVENRNGFNGAARSRARK